MDVYDLHCHSSFSDGTMTPKELVAHAVSLGLRGISVTDHDTTGAFEEGFALAKEHGLIFLPGIELSTEFRGESIHVLGYSFIPSSSSLRKACDLHRLRREARNREMLEKLVQKGMNVSYEEMIALSPEAITYGRPHIAKLLIHKGYVSSIQEAFRKYLGSGKPCFAAGKKWTTEEAIHIIHEAKGYAVIAHPHLIPKYQRVKDPAALPFDGIEAIYSRFTSADNNRYIELAQKRGLFITGGSDFHGSVKPETRLGIASAPYETVQILQERLMQHMLSQ